ncbi:MAG TPA: RDD family protein [Sulfurimonas autotrophica]|uniref:RDD family protein n=1 Tax=Sulfurimonas autotrophica TaxID=202747 RepID=A0A7C3G426_9BACT|nr:RDD family protein [Sulfurimonas autotrophica]
MSNEVRYAGFWIRFIASFLDTLFLALPLGILIYIISGGQWFDFAQYQQNLQMAMSGNPHALDNQPHTSFKWELVFEFSVLIATILFWDNWRGATPGKKFVHIKIVDAKTFEDITNKQAITRSLGYIPSTLLLGIGFLMVAFRKDKRALHDLLAGTAVIYDEDAL